MIQLPLQRPPLLSLDMLSFLPLALTLELILVFLFATVVIMQSAYLLRKGPFYRYTLPDDADQVRLEGCKGGIISLAYGFPHYLYQDDDTLESHVRAAEVLNRARLYPRDRSGMQLTNDFAMYCDLMVEGFRLGYHSFLQECLDAPDQLESVRQQIQSLSLLGEMVQWTVGSMLHGRAQRYFQKYRTEEAPERATE